MVVKLIYVDFSFDNYRHIKIGGKMKDLVGLVA